MAKDQVLQSTITRHVSSHYIIPILSHLHKLSHHVPLYITICNYIYISYTYVYIHTVYTYIYIIYISYIYHIYIYHIYIYMIYIYDMIRYIYIYIHDIRVGSSWYLVFPVPGRQTAQVDKDLTVCPQRPGNLVTGGTPIAGWFTFW